MARGYVFLERKRGVSFWDLDDTIERCRQDSRNGISAHFSIWVSQRAYLEFMSDTVEKITGIRKTRTMFSFSRHSDAESV